MSNYSPITPPPELRRQWLDNDDFPFVSGTCDLLSITRDRLNSVMDQAARWGADQEQEACAEWLDQSNVKLADLLRTTRRPKPPSLKALALALLDKAEDPSWDIDDFSIVRQALEALPND